MTTKKETTWTIEKVDFDVSEYVASCYQTYLRKGHTIIFVKGSLKKK